MTTPNPNTNTDAVSVERKLKPWVAFHKHKYDEWHVAIPTEGSFKLALCPDGILPGRSFEEREEVANRIVDCVNACAGIHDIHRLKSTAKAERELQKARELLLECRRYVVAVCQSGNIPVKQSPSAIVQRIDRLTQDSDGGEDA